MDAWDELYPQERGAILLGIALGLLVGFSWGIGHLVGLI